jgi:hypothetical protein
MSSDADLTTFEERATRLREWVAERYALPGSGGKAEVPQPMSGVPDPQKYVWPRALARLSRDASDSWAVAMVGQFWDRGGDPAPHASSFYHFGAYGLARLFFAFPSAVAPHRAALLAQAMREEQLFSGDGTENHIAMWRTSGYLFAQEAGDAARLTSMRDWLRGYARRLKEFGQGEWDSSTYFAFDVGSWLNVLDFAKDAEIREDARGVVETFTRQIALKYVQGAFAGAEKRGFSSRGVDTITGYLGWLWFGDVPTTADDAFFSQSAIYSVLASLSPYRPAPELTRLAEKRVEKPTVHVIDRPNYAMTRKAEARELLLVTPRYCVGTSVRSPIGGWGGGDTQETLWKFAAKGARGAWTVGGAGAGYAARNKFSGGGRSPWDQAWQAGPVVVQMTRVPRDAEELTAEAKSLFAKWKATGNAEKVSFADPVPASWAYATLPADAEIEERDGVLLVRRDGVFLVARPLHGAYAEVPPSETKAPPTRRVFRSESARAELCGWLYEFADDTEISYEDFAAALALPDRLRVSDLTVRYRDRRNQPVTVTFGTSGTYTEPEYDWGPQPTWPAGEGHGRVPG